MNDENKIIIECLNTFGRVPEQWELLKMIKQLQSNWNSLKELIEEEKTRLAKECSHTYEDSLGKTKYVNENIFNELNKISDKMNDLEGDNNGIMD